MPSKHELQAIADNEELLPSQRERAQALLSDSPSKSGSNDGGATARLLLSLINRQLAQPNLEKSWRENLLKQKSLREGEL